jgi:hypothetical protein
MAQKRIQVVGNHIVVRAMATALIRSEEVAQTSGLLVIDKTYVIDTVLSTDDFTNCGFVTAGVEFVATATTPTIWTNSTEVFEITDPTIALVVGRTYQIDAVEIGDNFTNVGFVSVGVEFVATGTTPTVWRNSTEVFGRIGEPFEAPNDDCFFYQKDGVFNVLPKTDRILARHGTQTAVEAEWVDEDGVALTGGVQTWMRTNVGFNSASGGSGALIEVADCGSTYEIDWNKDTFFLTMTEDCTFTETNLPATDKTKVITIYLMGNFVPTFPVAWTVNYAIIGAYDGVKNNQIVTEYVKEDYYWTTISQNT